MLKIIANKYCSFIFSTLFPLRAPFYKSSRNVVINLEIPTRTFSRPTSMVAQTFTHTESYRLSTPLTLVVLGSKTPRTSRFRFTITRVQIVVLTPKKG